jgi:hypothetical protein
MLHEDIATENTVMDELAHDILCDLAYGILSSTLQVTELKTFSCLLKTCNDRLRPNVDVGY